MFQIGDKIFYPMHGAGIIEAIEEKEILGEIQLYYVLNMTLTDMRVMIPAGKTDNLLIREAVALDKLDDVLATFQQGEPVLTDHPYPLRQRINVDKMKSGDIYEEVEVIRDLMCLSKNKKLNMQEKNMLDNARQMLISEVAVVKDLAEEQAAKLLNETYHLNI